MRHRRSYKQPQPWLALHPLKHLSTWRPLLLPPLPEEPHSLPAWSVPPTLPTQPEAQGLRAARSVWGGSPHLLLSFLFMLPGGGGVDAILQKPGSAPPASPMLQLLSPLGAGASSVLGKERGTAPPHPPQARGKEEAGERPKVPPPPTWGSLQAEVSGAAGPYPQSPRGLSLSPSSCCL